VTIDISSGSGTLDVTRGERAVVIGVDQQSRREGRSADARLDEAVGLAEAIGIDVVGQRTFRLRSPKPATLLGKGQVEEIAGMTKGNEAGLLVVDAPLTPVQQKSLEEQVGTKVIDRTGLILEIFGERAATAEGRLQVELAHLDYQAGRLVRSWTARATTSGKTRNSAICCSRS
jgi:GTP-binding protein HflX